MRPRRPAAERPDLHLRPERRRRDRLHRHRVLRRLAARGGPVLSASEKPERQHRWSGWDLAAIIVGAGYAVVYGWPASVQPWRYVWGSHGDALGNAYEYTWAAAMLHAGRPLTVNQQTAWPFGDALGSTPHDPLFWWFTIGLSYLIGAIPALNLLSLFAIPLATWAMYRLALRITRHSAASLVAGVAFGCSTYLLQNSRGEPTLVQAWVFPVEALALVSVMARPRLLTVVAAGVATALAASVG